MTKEEHLLTILVEECGEVAKEASKAIRFGSQEVYAPVGITNAERIVVELNDLMAIVQMLQAEGILGPDILNQARMDIKKKRVGQFMNYSKQVKGSL